MSTSDSDHGRSRKRLLAVGLGMAFAIASIGLALAFTSASGTRQVADNARQLHWTNAAIGSSALVRAANAQAVFFAVDRAAGGASADALQRATTEGTKALQALREVIESAPSLNAGLLTSLDLYHAKAAKVVELASTGEVEEALALNQTNESLFALVESGLRSQQQLIKDRIAATESFASRLASITQFTVTLLIPGAALIAYRFIVRRQLRERHISFEARLRAEQDLNRAKDEFIAGLSHEFRTPLTSIYGFSEVLLENGIIDPDSSLELIGLINTESAELSRMVEDLLVAARLEAEALTIQPGATDIRHEIDVVVAPWIRAGRTIQMDVPDALVWADPLRLRQVIRNLLSNALKHGGEQVGIWARIEREQLVCSVVDNGLGVSNDIAGKLFERFVHDGRRALLAGSVGLGLNIARSLMLEMEGDLVYERIRGTTWFTFRLPLAPMVTPSLVPAAVSS
ncbi:MAG: sensor histidine kinase [Acidimicrobiia bacterium]